MTSNVETYYTALLVRLIMLSHAGIGLGLHSPQTSFALYSNSETLGWQRLWVRV